MYIGGQWVDSSSSGEIEVLNPTNEEVIAVVPDANVEDGRRALEAARDAQPAWAALPAVQRGEYLMRFTAKLRENRERLARLLTLEQGKTYGLALVEIDATID
jgi:lactaldehyde dehydrogenase/glycolaldehyde dehydrogenase